MTKRDLLATTAHISGWPVPSRNPYQGRYYYEGSTSVEESDAALFTVKLTDEHGVSEMLPFPAHGQPVLSRRWYTSVTPEILMTGSITTHGQT